jgi:molecular chaperone GrpE
MKRKREDEANAEDGEPLSQAPHDDAGNGAEDTRLAAELAETRERYARALADHENARKRHQRELSDSRQYAITAFAGDLLEALDNMERAVAQAGDERRDDPLLLGVRMVADQLQKALKKHGVEAVEALGKPFDPNFHNAVAEDAVEGAAPGTVTAELMKGYRIGDRLLRPAMVKVAKSRS